MPLRLAPPARRPLPAVLPGPRPAPRCDSPAPPDFIPISVLDLKEGQRIEHNRFGYGDILELSGPPTDRKARIRFDDYGEKILLLKYAKLRLA